MSGCRWLPLRLRAGTIIAPIHRPNHLPPSPINMRRGGERGPLSLSLSCARASAPPPSAVVLHQKPLQNAFSGEDLHQKLRYFNFSQVLLRFAKFLVRFCFILGGFFSVLPFAFSRLCFRLSFPAARAAEHGRRILGLKNTQRVLPSA